MRRKLISASLAAFFLVQSAAFAQSSAAQDLIARIEADGYTVTDVRRSWFGRTVITATKENDLREVVLNPTSGEVLRDQHFPNESDDSEASTAPDIELENGLENEPANAPSGTAGPQAPSKPSRSGGSGGGGGGGGGRG